MNHDDEFVSDLDKKTIFKLRASPRWVEIAWLFIFLSGMAVAFGLLFLVQYWTCTLKNPDITMMQCIRHENLNPVKGKK